MEGCGGRLVSVRERRWRAEIPARFPCSLKRSSRQLSHDWRGHGEAARSAVGGLGGIGGVFGRGDAGGSAMVNVAFSRCGDAALGRGGVP